MTAAFRRPTRQEQTAVARALGRWGAYDALAGSTFLVKDEKTVCMLSPELERHVLKLQPDVAGLEIGELGKRTFAPTMAGADLFARAAGAGGAKDDDDGDGSSSRRKYYVSVSENAEKLVLYGRDVMGDSILRAWEGLGENELVILTNEKGEAIGVGRTRFAGRSSLLRQKGRITITTLADAGGYLRDEDESRVKMAGAGKKQSARRPAD